MALPFLAAWLASPAVAWWLSRPVVPRRLALSAEDARQLRRVARRTWRYFERFVTAQDHGLPPDNVQEGPEPRIAHRTSPTDIGMGLLATLAAHDLGYLDTDEFAERIEETLSTVESLERHEGHLLNWYDTVNLAPLNPRYVSTVDSGNLAGALMALAAGLRQLAEASEDPQRLRAGVLDTAGVLGDTLAALARDTHAATPRRQQCGVALRELDALRARLAEPGPAPGRDGSAPADIGALGAALKRVTADAAAGPGAGEIGHWRRGAARRAAPMDDRHRPVRRPAGAPRGPRPALRRGGRRHGVEVPLRPPGRDLLHRFPARRRRGTGPPRHLVLRPAGVGIPARQLHRHRPRRGAAGALVPALARAGERRGPLHPGVVERLDVRVPDAAAGAAQPSRDAARAHLPRGGAARRSSTAIARTCRGASPSPRSAWWTRTATTSTRPSASPAWDSSAGSPWTW